MWGGGQGSDGDGREIFDEEMGDEKPGQRSTKGLDKSKKSGHNKKKDTNNTTSEESSSSKYILKFFGC